MIENYNNGDYIGRCDLCGASHYVSIPDIDYSERDEVNDGYYERGAEDEEEAVAALRDIGWERDISGAILCPNCAEEADRFWRGERVTTNIESVIMGSFNKAGESPETTSGRMK